MTEPSPDLRARLQDGLGSTYEIERELGGGGMSRVFLARETALGRKVVLKVLPPELAASVNADRFKREIQMAAQLQHSCIVPVLAAGTADGLPYFTMPFVEGESLRARLDREGELPLAEAIRYTRDMLEALSHAHEQGLVHRDIKPENVLLSKHHAVIADFGVAKALSASTSSGSSGLTSLGVALGTPAYMAPEQAAADPAVDSRADLYAVGAVAYEMLTGQKMFSARSPAAMLAAQATESPEPVDKRRPSVPPVLAALVMRLLEKRPADRPRSADEALHELESMNTPTGGLAPTTVLPSVRSTRARLTRRALVYGFIALSAAGLVAAWFTSRNGDAPATNHEALKSIAVLPFANIGGSADNEYLSDGLSEELIGALSKVEGLQVAARSSSFSFKGKNEDVRSVGTKLGVSAVLGGSVRRAGNRLRVSAQLTNVSTGYNLWSDTYDREMTDVFGLQEDISRAIVDALEIRLASSASGTPIVKRGTADPEAYELYLRGRYLLTQRGASLVPAREHFERAIARDGRFAAAYAGLAETIYVASTWGYGTAFEAVTKAESNARRALELDPASTDAYIVLGTVRCVRGKFAEAESLFNQAISIDPRSGRLHYFHAFCLNRQGRPAPSLAAARKATELEPLNPQLFVGLIRAYTMGNRPREALAARRPALELAPNLLSLHSNADHAYVLLRDAEAIDSIAEMSRVSAVADSKVQADLFRAIAAAVRGDRARALEHAQPYIRNPPPGREMTLAGMFSVLRDENETLRLIDLAYSRLADQGAEVNYPTYDWIRSRPMFQSIASKYGIPLRIEPLD
ncbi:MAG: protein kinase domain-containing protein [Gemmatimonadaceae bacterium]